MVKQESPAPEARGVLLRLVMALQSFLAETVELMEGQPIVQLLVAVAQAAMLGMGVLEALQPVRGVAAVVAAVPED